MKIIRDRGGLCFRELLPAGYGLAHNGGRPIMRPRGLPTIMGCERGSKVYQEIGGV